jgi:hypothetical protein
VEARTSAELVIAVRRRSGDYRADAYHLGFGAMGLVVGTLLFVPQNLLRRRHPARRVRRLPRASLLARNLDSITRRLVRRTRRQANVDLAARAASKSLASRGRWGETASSSSCRTFEALARSSRRRRGRHGARRTLEAAIGDLRAAVPALIFFLPSSPRSSGSGRSTDRDATRARRLNELPDEVQ